MLKKTPFYYVSIGQGAQMKELFGYWLPWEYSTGYEEEYKATRQRASLCDLGYMAEFIIEGPEAAAFIQKVFTDDFSNLSIGSVRYTAMTDLEGNLVNEGALWRLGESRYMYISSEESDYEWLEKCTDDFDIELINITSEWTTLLLQGPLSTKVLRKLTDTNLGSNRYYKFTEGKVSGVDCLIARIGFAGGGGYELHFHSRHAEKMWKAIMNAGKADRVVPCGQAALENLRQEASFLLVGKEHSRSMKPLEAGIG